MIVQMAIMNINKKNMSILSQNKNHVEFISVEGVKCGRNNFQIKLGLEKVQFDAVHVQRKERNVRPSVRKMNIF